MPRRFALTPEGYTELKRRVLKRDAFRCRKCKSRNNLHAHHIQFRSDGGGDTSGNLCTLCSKCHDSVHGKISNLFIVIVNPESDLIPPDADVGLRFKTFNNVRKRVTWRTR